METKRRERLRSFFEIGDVIVGQVDHRAQRLQRGLEIVNLLRHQLQLINGAVERQRGAVAIVDNAAAGRDRHQLDAVFVGAGAVILDADHLQIIQVGDQDAGQHQDDQERHQGAAYKQGGFSRIVAKRVTFYFHPAALFHSVTVTTGYSRW